MTHGFIERDGVRIAYDVHGEGETTVFLLPTWSIVPSRYWKLQVPYLARHFRVLTFDGRGSGGSDRPPRVEDHLESEYAADALAVMDAAGVERAVVVAISCGALWGTLLAADHPERVASIAYIGPAVPFVPGPQERAIVARFDEPLDTEEGWAKHNVHYWRRDYEGFLRFFFGEMFCEPHSTKQIEDGVAWGLETDVETLALTERARTLCGLEAFAATCRRVRCPVLVIHGDRDRIRPHDQGAALAHATGGRLVTLEGSGHGPNARDPVAVNRLLRDFAGAPAPARWTRPRSRRRRALYVSSPIGLGHARRDVAIARELRARVPDLEIEWLAQHPVTRVLEDAGERIHPASRQLLNESAHWESEADDHDLHCFEAWRRMDEILCANFMVFDDVVREDAYDLWIGDEAWELDHFLHENPELKRAPFAWLTDFVGWLPMPEGGEREAALTADYNAEMIERIERFPRVRDRAIFVGDAEDVVDASFGPGLPGIRDWTREHFAFAGYVASFDAASLDREALRAQLGWNGPTCVAAVGGSGVGAHLLSRVAACLDAARELVPGLRMVLVTGPRIDPADFPPRPGLEVRAYVPDLYRLLAACDLALVQGGLTTAMELTAARTPFLYFPLRRHVEQRVHVHHRLRRYRAGRQMELDDDIAAAIAEEIGRPVDYRAVERDGAARAAELIAGLL